MTLNRYGLLALDFCRHHRPNAWAALPDPLSTFEAIGGEIQAEVTQALDRLLGDPRPGENPLDLAHRVAQAISTAEELVITDHPAFRPEATEDLTEPDPALDEARATLAMVNAAIHHR